MNRIFILVLTSLIISSCGGSYYTKAQLAGTFTQEEVLGAAASVIIAHGFAVELAIGSVGVLNTGWKEVRMSKKTIRIKLHFTYKENENVLIMVPFYQEKLKNGSYKNISIGKGNKYFTRIMKRVTLKLNNKVKIFWIRSK
jgi:hypothetical protein